MRRALPGFAALGAAVVGIAGQAPATLARWAAAHDPGFPLLADESRAVIRAYGVFHALSIDAWRMARPAAFVLDSDHRVAYQYVSRHQADLPPVDRLLEVVRGLARPEHPPA